MALMHACVVFLFSVVSLEAETSRIFFVDEAVRVSAEVPAEAVDYELSILTDSGIENLGSRTARNEDGFIEIRPDREGIYVVRIDGKAAWRFLAVTPPPAIDSEALRQALPLTHGLLTSSDPYVVGVYGDSVTATGDYPEILARFFERALHLSSKIRIIRKAHPGCSIDATLRNWDTDIAADAPNLALVMYGLNDQAAGVSLDVYLRQWEYLARRIRQEHAADLIFLQPTSHIDVFPRPENGQIVQNDPSFAFRTIGFAVALHDLARRLDIPCSDTFHAVWNPNNSSLIGCAKLMQARFPPSYSRSMDSMLETPGEADTIHPNILGHLAIARAVWATLIGQKRESSTFASAELRWQEEKLVCHVRVGTHEESTTEASISIFTLPERRCVVQESISLGRKGEHTFTFDWPGINTPQDLLDPTHRDLAANLAQIAVVTTIRGKTDVQGVSVPFSPANFIVRGRWDGVKEAELIKVTAFTPETSQEISIPADSDAGCIPLLQHTGSGWAAAKLWYLRYLRCGKGEVQIDGDLAEWEHDSWTDLGLPLHARWVRGPEDHRATSAECAPQFSVKSGEKNLYLAIKGQGDWLRDQFTIFFDPRSSELLGSPGGYFWMRGSFNGPNQIELQVGDNSPITTRCDGMFISGRENRLEMSIPYEALGVTSWPASGDLGFSFWWSHVGHDGRTTNLQWSDTGHPWSPRGFGVIRRTESPVADLPFSVRIE